MAQNIDRWETVTLTQGVADAFVQGTIATGIDPESGMGWLIKRIDFQFSALQLSALAADAEISWSVTRDTKTGVVGYTDGDTIYHDGVAFALTTSGTFCLPSVQSWIPPDGLVFVEPTMYAQLDSTGTTQALGVAMRIHYEFVKLTEVEILRLLQNS